MTQVSMHPTKTTPLVTPVKTETCLTNRKTTQAAKAAFWTIASIAALFIPVPGLNGAVAGGAMFMGLHELLQHPDSIYMTNFSGQKRSWKELAAGCTISATGWGLGTFSLTRSLSGQSSPLALAGGMLGLLVGTGASLIAAYGRRPTPQLPATTTNA